MRTLSQRDTASITCYLFWSILVCHVNDQPRSHLFKLKECDITLAEVMFLVLKQTRGIQTLHTAHVTNILNEAYEPVGWHML